MNQELATRQPIEAEVVAYSQPSPDEYIAYATKQANALKRVVDQQQLFSMIQGKKFPKAEAWQTIMALDGACPTTQWCVLLKDEDGTPVGYNAKVDLIKNGQVIASAEMACGFDDYPCKGKTGMAQHRAAQSSAQTWAGAKAGRMKYAWIMTLAGYEPTPAEEVEQLPNDKPAQQARPARQQTSRQEPAERPATGRLGVCTEHNKAWGKMDGGRIGHPVPGQGPCYKDEQPEAPPDVIEGESREIDEDEVTYESVLERAGSAGLDQDAFEMNVLRQTLATFQKNRANDPQLADALLTAYLEGLEQ